MVAGGGEEDEQHQPAEGLPGRAVSGGGEEEGAQRGVEVSGPVQRVTPAAVLIKLINCVLLCYSM